MGFDEIFATTVGLEGGYSDNPKDPGNWTGGKVGAGELKGTNFGISAASYPNLDIKNLTISGAKAIYKSNFWDVLRLDEVSDNQIQDEIFDAGVNMGVAEAGIIVQRAIDFLEPGAPNFPLVIDGIIGAATLSYIDSWIVKDLEALFKAIDGFKFMRYVEICYTTNKIFDWGWMKRIQEWKGSQ